MADIMERLQGHQQDSRSAVRVGNDALVLADILRIDLRHNQRHFRVHAESTGVVNDYSTGFYSCRSELLAGSAACEKSNIHTLEGICRGFFNGIILAHEIYNLACRTLGCQHLELCKGEITLFNKIQEFLANCAGSAQNCHIVLFHAVVLPL